MDTFSDILKTYFKKPYRPEFLVKKVKDSFKNQNFVIIQKSNNEIIKENFNKIFVPIFGSIDYKFNDKVETAKSLDNFQNFIYESCKSDYKLIQKEAILAYVFILDEFKERIINTIYQASQNQVKSDICSNLLDIFLSKKVNSININNFDKKFFDAWMNETKENEDSLKKNNNNNIDDILNLDNIKINLLKYNYYGPNETKKNYYLNNNKENVKNFNSKVVLFSPDFLLQKKILKKYDKTNFQLFNKNNTYPDLFAFLLNEAIKILNDNLVGSNINNNNFISDIGIMHFSDQTAGIYLNAINNSEFYELEDIKSNLIADDKKEDLLEVVVSNTTSMKSESKTITGEEELTYEQQYYTEYNSHVNEEQLSTVLIDKLSNKLINESVERMPNVIFYFNLYIFQNSDKKLRIAFTGKDKAYGFEEADGIFYLKSDKVEINEKSNIPFLEKMKFTLFPLNNSVEYEKNSLIYMEVKNSFPLKYEKGEKKLKGLEETKSLLYNIIRRSKKFYEIANKKNKEIEQIHIFFLYDSLLQKQEDIRNFSNIFLQCLNNPRIKVNIKTVFEVIYFVNPSSINMRELSKTVASLKNEINDSIEKFQKLEENNKKLNEDNEDKNKRLKELEESYKKLNEDNEEKNKRLKELEERYKTLIELNQIAIKQLEEHENKNKLNEELIKSLSTKIDELTKNEAEKANMNSNNINMDYNLNNNEIIEMNNIIKKNQEKVFNIIRLKNENGKICVSTMNNAYIIQNNKIQTLLGYRHIILQLGNGNLLTVKNTKIIIYFPNKNFSEKKEIDINRYSSQIIELNNKGIMVLSENSELIMIQNEEISKIIDDIQNISSIIETYNNEIAIVLKDKNLLFYNLENQKELKRLGLISNANLITLPFLYVYNKNLYVSLFDCFYKVDIEKKIILTKFDLKYRRMYCFGYDFFGINNNCLYEIIDDNNKIKENKICEESSNILCLCQLEEKKLILSTDDGIIKFINLK